MIRLSDTLEARLYLPLDPKECNYYDSDGVMFIETKAQYLARISGIQPVTKIITFLEPKIGQSINVNGYNIANGDFVAALTNFEIKYYKFNETLTDLIELIFYTSEDGILSENNFTDVYKEKLDTLKVNPYTLTLNASSDVATRLVGLISGTNYPTGWALSSGSGVNLIITHNLNRKLDTIVIYESDSGIERMAKPFEDAYSGVTCTNNIVTIEGLDTLAVNLRIVLNFE